MKAIVPIILCGGFGERLWPLSRHHAPKQFAPLVGDDHLFAMCVERALAIAGASHIIAVGNEDHRFLISETLTDKRAQWSVLLEPAARNTAAAICAAAFATRETLGEDAVMVILPSDHYMPDVSGFADTISKAISEAQGGVWVTLGITPDHPSTQYGYITANGNSAAAMDIVSFKEKPDDTAARQLIADGALWNAGMFIVMASVALASFEALQPDIYSACHDAYVNRKIDGHFVRLDKAAFMTAPALPVDIAIMEKLTDARVVPYKGEWSDLGSWTAVASFATPDENGNRKSGDVHFINSSNSYVRSNRRLTYAIGLKDTVVVDTADALVVAAADQLASVRDAVKSLKQNDRPEVQHHARVARPWGSFESLATGPQYQVKRIVVRPGASLSLQYHHHRAEHWVVVRGLARVTCGDRVFDLDPNQSTYIPLGETHRLENPGTEELEIIEVQSGDYLGEDDIVRLDDEYGRVGEDPT